MVASSSVFSTLSSSMGGSSRYFPFPFLAALPPRSILADLAAGALSLGVLTTGSPLETALGDTLLAVSVRDCLLAALLTVLSFLDFPLVDGLPFGRATGSTSIGISSRVSTCIGVLAIGCFSLSASTRVSSAASLSLVSSGLVLVSGLAFSDAITDFDPAEFASTFSATAGFLVGGSDSFCGCSSSSILLAPSAIDSSSPSSGVSKSLVARIS
mmetsp:Transcript_11794/g.18586  ORF Transcript_11794/g.18586 Transcript_11794/m.18586 type:complete len:213 (-) Transcript_11794:1519-2157(-)